MNAHLRNGIACLCLFLPSGASQLYAQEESRQQQPKQEQSSDKTPTQPETQANPGDAPFSVELFIWPTTGHPTLRNGKASTSTNVSELAYPGKSKPTPGIEVSLPGGRYNNLRLSYFRTQGNGNTSASRDLTFFSTGFSQGDLLAASYTLQNAKVSFDYLSYPVPPGNSRFRLKTLWEVQLTSIRSSIDAPLKLPTTDSSGAPASTTARGTNWFIYPTLGVGIEHLTSQRFRWDVKASGFAVPHRSTTWEAEIKGVYRFGQFEALAGVRGFHFKTSPKREEYVRATLSGAYVGLRWRTK